MADDFDGDDLSRMFREPEEFTMEALLADIADAALPQQAHPAADEHAVAVAAIDPPHVVQPVDVHHPADGQPGHAAQPPAPAQFGQDEHMLVDDAPPVMDFEYYQRILAEVPLPPAQHVEQHQEIPAGNEVPPAATQNFQQHQPVLAGVEAPPAAAPATNDQHHQTMPAAGEVPPATHVHFQQYEQGLRHFRQFQAQQVPAGEVPPPPPMTQSQPCLRELLRELVASTTPEVHRLPTLAELSAAWRAAAAAARDQQAGGLNIDNINSANGAAAGTIENSSGGGGGGATFVPITMEQYLGCDDDGCRTVREARHINGRLVHYCGVHRDAKDGKMVHAMAIRICRDNAQELLRLDVSRRSHAWVLRFMARIEETMRSQGGTVKVQSAPGESGGGDGGSSSSAAPLTEGDEAEIDRLCELFASSPPAPARDAAGGIQDG